MKPFHEDREPWTDDREAVLKRLWKDGYSASQIAKKMGGCTRNAVIGKVSRLGLSSRKVPSRPVRRDRPTRVIPAGVDGRTLNHAPRSRIVLRPPCKPLDPPTAVTLEPLMVSVLALTSGMCRWPTGEGREHLFCGHPWHGEHGPYCATHTALAYVKPTHKVRPPKTQRAKSISIDWLEAA
jgi:GcrA cell cycle regulator